MSATPIPKITDEEVKAEELASVESSADSFGAFSFARSPELDLDDNYEAVFALKPDAMASFTDHFSGGKPLIKLVLGKGSYGVVLDSGTEVVKIGLLPRRGEYTLRAGALNELSVWRRLGYPCLTYQLAPPRCYTPNPVYSTIYEQVSHLPYRLRSEPAYKDRNLYYVVHMPKHGQMPYFKYVRHFYRVAASASLEQKVMAAHSFIHHLLPAVAQLHKLGVYHCDLMPSNIMVDVVEFEGVPLVSKVYLVDFGSSQGSLLLPIEQILTTQSFAQTWARAKHFQSESLDDPRTDYVAMAWSIAAFFNLEKVIDLESSGDMVTDAAYMDRELWLKDFLNTFWGRSESFKTLECQQQAKYIIHVISELLTRVNLTACLSVLIEQEGSAAFVVKPSYLTSLTTIEEQFLLPDAPSSRRLSAERDRRSGTPGSGSPSIEFYEDVAAYQELIRSHRTGSCCFYECFKACLPCCDSKPKPSARPLTERLLASPCHDNVLPEARFRPIHDTGNEKGPIN